MARPLHTIDLAALSEETETPVVRPTAADPAADDAGSAGAANALNPALDDILADLGDAVLAPADDAAPLVITGTPGPDTIYGGDLDDVLSGRGGDDLINGNAGNDLIHGNNGNDYLKGGEGDDLVFGDAGHDKLRGGSGDDMLAGGAGNDDLGGGDGSDRLEGGRGLDTLAGGAGRDYFVAGFSGSGWPGQNHQPDIVTDWNPFNYDSIDLRAVLDQTLFTGSKVAEAFGQGYVYLVQHGVYGDPDYRTTVHIDYNGAAADLASRPDVAVFDLVGIGIHQLNTTSDYIANFLV